MSFADAIGFFYVTACTLLMTATIGFLAYRGGIQLLRELRLGADCLKVADEVMSDIETPVLRQRGEGYR